jgi:hypothetical protein
MTCRWLHLPQLQRRAFSDGENDAHRYAAYDRYDIRFAALLHLPVWCLVDEETRTPVTRIRNANPIKTQELDASPLTITAFYSTFLFSSRHLCICPYIHLHTAFSLLATKKILLLGASGWWAADIWDYVYNPFGAMNGIWCFWRCVDIAVHLG